NVLNARQDREEAMVVAEAGHAGRITVATNIAGRGTDIKLPPDVIDGGGLHVILTEFHESARIDRALRAAGQSRQFPNAWFPSKMSCSNASSPGSRALAAALMRKAGPKVASLVGHALRRWGQQKAERIHAKTRRESVERDRRLDKALAFAGKSE